MLEACLPTTVESLPTELWCEVFKYFDAIELYRTFNNINSRINLILSENTPLYFKITTTGDYDFSSCTILPKVKNRANVRSFKFYYEFQVEEFFTLWPINIFSQLRCLSLVYLGALMSDCSIELIEQLSTLTNFEYLHIRVTSIPHRDQYLKRLIQLIFVENDAFHSLKHLVFQCHPQPSNTLSLPETTKQTKLEYLTLPSLCVDDFIQLLTCIPHIKSLQTDRLYTDFSTQITLATIASLNSAWSNCLNLNLQLDEQWTFEDIEVLLRQVPNVNQLKLTCNHVLINGNRWGVLLAENCSKLRIFELVFTDCYFGALPLFIDLQSSFSTRFWLQQNVQFEHNERFHHFTVRIL